MLHWQKRVVFNLTALYLIQNGFFWGGGSFFCGFSASVPQWVKGLAQTKIQTIWVTWQINWDGFTDEPWTSKQTGEAEH